MNTIENNEKWLVMAKKADFNQIGNMFNVSPIIARIIRNRDIISMEEINNYLNGGDDKLHSPEKFKDMEKAVKIILKAIENQVKIRVIGDYDIDGICAGYILTDGIKRLGGNVDFDVPERILDGYGINERIIKQAYEDGVKLIITCDNGIAASIQVEYAKSLSMDIVITDHHEVPFIIENNIKKYIVPKADAVVNHKQQDCGYPFKDLCGGGVALKLVDYLYDKFKEQLKEQIDLPEKQQFLSEYYMFCAIATIGDIVDLQGENRIIVKIGMKEIEKTSNIGLRKLIEVNGLSDKLISSYHISFVIGPCINAGGRLDSAKLAFSLFSSKEESEALKLATELKELNDKRKQMTVDYVAVAEKIIDEDKRYNTDKILVVYLSGCHESLAGIIAGRIKDKYYKPTFVLTDSEDGGLKGSGRSIEGYSMFEEMVAANQMEKNASGSNLFIKFGGHKMAAGLSIEKHNLNLFRDRINECTQMTDEMLVRKIWIDVPLPFDYLDYKLINQLQLLEPFGKGNEKPVFADKCTIINKITIRGKNRNVIIINMTNKNGKEMQGVLFENEDKFVNYLLTKYNKSDIENAFLGRSNPLELSVIYYPEINEFNGNSNIRVVIKRYS